MTDAITLSRQQWNELFDGLELIRDRYDALFEVASALTVLGLDKPAGTITAVEDDIAATVKKLHETLIQADNGKPERLVGYRFKRAIAQTFTRKPFGEA